MRHAVLAAALAFTGPLGVRNLMVPGATRRVAGVVLAWLDRRRGQIDEG